MTDRLSLYHSADLARFWQTLERSAEIGTGRPVVPDADRRGQGDAGPARGVVLDVPVQVLALLRGLHTYTQRRIAAIPGRDWTPPLTGIPQEADA